MNGYWLAEKITKHHAKTFYFASHFLPRDKQKAACAIYAICRLSDDSVDASSDPKKQLDLARKNIEKAYAQKCLDNGIIGAFSEVVKKYQIPKVYFDELIKGMEMDITKNRYNDFNELHEYCYRVAGVIGLIMLRIFGTDDERAHQHAINLGVAMQLTNILRDIKEDYAMGRIYLPQDEMRQFGITEEYISNEKVNSKTISLLQFQIRRAQNYYMRAERGFSLIKDKRSRFVARIMGHIYQGILTAIERNNYNVFRWRANISIWGKIGRTLQALFLR